MKQVLAAVDASDAARKALVFARDLTRRFGARLTMVHVIEPLPQSTTEQLGLPEDEVRQAQLRAGSALLERLAAELDVSDAEQVLLLGRASELICAEADEIDADLVVLGHCGEGPYPRVTLGSVGTRVAALSTRSVAIIR